MGKKDKLSIFISLVLRHRPDAAGIQLDEHGWANVDELIDGINSTGRKINTEMLDEKLLLMKRVGMVIMRIRL